MLSLLEYGDDHLFRLIKKVLDFPHILTCIAELDI